MYSSLLKGIYFGGHTSKEESTANKKLKTFCLKSQISLKNEANTGRKNNNGKLFY